MNPSQVAEFQFAINTQVIGKNNADKLSYRGAFRPARGSFASLADHIGKGHPWMPALLDAGARRYQHHANYAEVLAIDVDNAGKDKAYLRQLTIEDSLNHPFFKAHCGLGIESASSKPDWNKARFIFRLPKPIHGHKLIALCNKYLMNLVGVADPSCKDASRFFFGAPGRTPFIINEHATLPDDFVEQAIAWDESIKAENAAKKAEREAALKSFNTANSELFTGEISLELVKQALTFIPPRTPGTNTYHESLGVLFALYNTFGEDEAIELANEWSPKEGDWDPEAKIRGFKNSPSPDEPITIGTLFFHAKQHGFQLPKIKRNRDEERAWRRQKLKESATSTFNSLAIADADIEQVARFANQAGFQVPKLGQVVLVDAFTGAGKSTLFREWKDALSRDENVMADLITHRNALARLTGENMGMKHISDCKVEGEIQASKAMVANEPALAYCIDSFLKRYEGLMRHIGYGGKVLLILDELNALLEHLLIGGTLKGIQRLNIIAAFSSLLQAIADGHGWIIGGEAHLTKTAVETLKGLSGNQLKVTVCRVTNGNPKPWIVNTYRYPLNRLNIASYHKVRELLSQGKRVLFMTGSKEAGEHYELLFKGYKIRRVDSDTIGESETNDFVQTINDSLPLSGLDCLIASPTLGIGVDITAPFFDAVVVNGSAMDPFTILQMAGRDRNPVERHLFMADNSGGDSTFKPKEITEKWRKSLDKAMSRYGLNHFQKRGVIIAAEELSANFEAMRNAGKTVCHDITAALIASDGHTMIEGEILDKDTLIEMSDYYAIAHDELILIRLTEYKAAEMLSSEKEAEDLLNRDDVRRKDRISAIKTLDFARYGDRIFDDEFVIKARCNGRKSDEYRRSLDRAVRHENHELAYEEEKERITRSLEATGTISATNFDSEVELIELLTELDFYPVLQHVMSNPYTQDDELIQAFFERCKAEKARVKAVMGLTITDKSPVIGFINDFLRLRFACEVGSKRPRSKSADPHGTHIDSNITRDVDQPPAPAPKRVYFATKFENRDELIERLRQRAEERLEASKLAREQELGDRSLPTYKPVQIPLRTPLKHLTAQPTVPVRVSDGSLAIDFDTYQVA